MHFSFQQTSTNIQQCQFKQCNHPIQSNPIQFNRQAFSIPSFKPHTSHSQARKSKTRESPEDSAQKLTKDTRSPTFASVPRVLSSQTRSNAIQESAFSSQGTSPPSAPSRASLQSSYRSFYPSIPLFILTSTRYIDDTRANSPSASSPRLPRFPNSIPDTDSLSRCRKPPSCARSERRRRSCRLKRCPAS